MTNTNGEVEPHEEEVHSPFRIQLPWLPQILCMDPISKSATYGG